jgi:hypothetical protein
VTNPTMIRQGDVLLVPVEAIPEGTQPIARVDGRLILAWGEESGHAHAILAPDADLYELVSAHDVYEMRSRFLEVEAEVALVHDEHAPLALPPGLYEVRRQREYFAPRVSRPVVD